MVKTHQAGNGRESRDSEQRQLRRNFFGEVGAVHQWRAPCMGALTAGGVTAEGRHSV